MISIGEEYVNKFNEKFKVINKTTKGYVIQFDNGYIKETRDKYILSKGVHSPYARTLLGIGYIGDGKYNSKDDKIAYKAWSHMHTRCYDYKYINKFPSYKNCYVCMEWHNFQNFAEWWYENLWDYEKTYFLDKDILCKGNKCYSPTKCCLVNNHINCLFTKRKLCRGDLPIGVSIDNRTHQYRAIVYSSMNTTSNIYITDKNLTNEQAIQKAFNMYKESKEANIKNVADFYKSKYPKFPQKVYNALYNYQVEITD